MFFPPGLIEQHKHDRAADVPIGSKSLAQLDTASQLRPVAERYERAFPQQSPFERRLRLLTGEEYWIPTVRLADAHAGAGGETYAYRFERPVESGLFAGYTPHASELPLVWDKFDDPFSGLFYQPESAPKALAAQMHAAWVSFIKGGAPTAAGLAKWERYLPTGANARKTMLLRDQSVLVADPSSEERQLWDGTL